MPPLRVAVLGENPVLSELSEALARSDDTTLLGQFNDVSQISPTPSCEAIFLASPSHRLTSDITFALEQGVHILSVARVPSHLEDQIAILRAERAAPKTHLQFAYPCRYQESVGDALRLAGTGQLGKLLSLRAVIGTSAPQTDESGPWMPLAADMVDLMLAFAGPFVDIKGLAAGSSAKPLSETANLMAALRTHDSAVASFHLSTTQWRQTFRLELGYENGYLWLEGHPGADVFGPEALVSATSEQNLEEVVQRYQESSRIDRMLADFVKSIRTSTKPIAGSSQQAFDVLNTLQRIEAADDTLRYEIEDPAHAAHG